MRMNEGGHKVRGFWKGQCYGSFYLNLDVFRRNLEIFNCFKGALDHLLTRTQFWRFSPSERLSLDRRLFGLPRKRPLNEKRRLLSLPVRLSMNDRSVRCMERTSVSRFRWMVTAPTATDIWIQPLHTCMRVNRSVRPLDGSFFVDFFSFCLYRDRAWYASLACLFHSSDQNP